MTITSDELAQALKGCVLRLRFLKYEDNSDIHVYEAVEVTPPPKKPEVKVECAGWSGERSNGSPLYAPWVLEADFSKSIYRYWLRRETIDGMVQRPTVVSAEDGKS